MFRLLSFLVALVTMGGAAAHAQTTGVQITWIGQAGFMIQTAGANTTVITDPPNAAQGYPLPEQPADAVTISHNHGDHNNSAGVRGSFTLVDGRPVAARQDMTVAGIPFVMIPGFHDNQNGAQRGPNTIIRWTQGGIRFAHFGDFGQSELTESQLADLGVVDVIFVPAGGFFTIDLAGVDSLIAQARPRVAVLMHYRTALGGPAQLASFSVLSSSTGGRPIRFRPARVALTPSQLPVATEYWIMEVAADMAAVNAAGFGAGQPVAPGSLVSVFGNFAGSSTSAAASAPLPRLIGETEVLVNGAAAPLLYVSPSQINFQLSRSLETGQFPVEVRVAGQRAARGPVSVLPTAPGLFAALNQDGRRNSASIPARRGEVLQIYATGQGTVANAVEDGELTPLAPLIPAVVPVVTIGGRPATVQFSGLAPLFVGLWQINVVVPADAPSGANVAVVATAVLGSNTLSVAIQ